MSGVDVLALIDREIREQERRAAKHEHTEDAHHRHLYAAKRMSILAERIIDDSAHITADDNEVLSIAREVAARRAGLMQRLAAAERRESGL